MQSGGLHVLGKANLDGCNVYNNTATEGSGGISNHGKLMLTDTSVTLNTAGACGGGLSNDAHGNLTLLNSTVANNTAAAAGGGLHSRGDLTLLRSTIFSNRADTDGGGLYNRGRLVLQDTTLFDNKPDDTVGGCTHRSEDGSTCTVYNTSELVAAVNLDIMVRTVIVAAGTYDLSGAMIGKQCGDSDTDVTLFIGRPLTIRAEESGTVVFDGMRKLRVIYVSESGRAELIGLNITGGSAADDDVRAQP